MCCCMWSKRRGQSTRPRTRSPADRSVQQVGDALALVDHVHDIGVAEPAGVERLAAGGGIERGAVEVDPPAVVRAVDDGGVELGQVGVGVVQALGHAL